MNWHKLEIRDVFAVAVVVAVVVLTLLPAFGCALAPALIDAALNTTPRAPVVVAPPAAPAEPAAPAPAEPPVVPVVPVDPPAVEPTPAPAPEPERDLELLIRDGNQRPISSASATNVATGEVRKVSDGDGRIHFRVRGPVVVEATAPGYLPSSRHVPPGQHVINLAYIPGQEPKPAPPVSACGFAAVPTANRLGCLLEVGGKSANWAKCQTGDPVGCHRYIREAAAKLNAVDATDRWGLIAKQPGEQQCTLVECGSIRGGFAEDAIAYRPGDALDDWIGFDLVGNAGTTDARITFTGPLQRRVGNIWAAVPKP